MLYDAFIRGGEDYQFTPDVIAAIKEYKAENDYMTEWFSEALIVTDKKEDCLLWSATYFSFTHWFRGHHPNEKTPSKKVVKPQLEKLLKVPVWHQVQPGDQETVCGMGGREGRRDETICLFESCIQ